MIELLRTLALLLEAVCSLALARVGLRLLPFRRLAATLGERQAVTAALRSPETQDRAEEVGWALGALARLTPWKSNCLTQAVAAQWMLGRRHIPSTLYLGVARGTAEPGTMAAHAWVACGARTIAGVTGHERYAVIATFGRRVPTDEAFPPPKQAIG